MKNLWKNIEVERKIIPKNCEKQRKRKKNILKNWGEKWQKPLRKLRKIDKKSQEKGEKSKKKFAKYCEIGQKLF